MTEPCRVDGCDSKLLQLVPAVLTWPACPFQLFQVLHLQHRSCICAAQPKDGTLTRASVCAGPDKRGIGAVSPTTNGCPKSPRSTRRSAKEGALLPGLPPLRPRADWKRRTWSTASTAVPEGGAAATFHHELHPFSNIVGGGEGRGRLDATVAEIGKNTPHELHPFSSAHCLPACAPVPKQGAEGATVLQTAPAAADGAQEEACPLCERVLTLAVLTAQCVEVQRVHKLVQSRAWTAHQLESMMDVPTVRASYVAALEMDVANGCVGASAGAMQALLLDLMCGELGLRLHVELYE